MNTFCADRKVNVVRDGNNGYFGIQFAVAFFVVEQLYVQQ